MRWVNEQNRTLLCWVGQKVWVFSKMLQKNPNKLFGQPNVNCGTTNLGWTQVEPRFNLPSHETSSSHFALFFFLVSCCMIQKGFPGGGVVKNLPAIQEKQRLRFDPWVRKIPWSRKEQLPPAFWPGKFHRQRRCGLQAMGSQRIRHDWAHVHETKTTWKIKTIAVNESHSWRNPSFQSKLLPRGNSYFWIVGCASF